MRIRKRARPVRKREGKPAGYPDPLLRRTGLLRRHMGPRGAYALACDGLRSTVLLPRQRAQPRATVAALEDASVTCRPHLVNLCATVSLLLLAPTAHAWQTRIQGDGTPDLVVKNSAYVLVTDDADNVIVGGTL